MTVKQRLIASSRPVSNLIASVAWMEATTLTMPPSIPAVSQVGVEPGGGGSTIRQRKQAVWPGTIVIVCPSAPIHPP